MFVLGGALPLGLCLVWSAQQFLPTYQYHQAKRWEQFLSSQLGVSVTVAAYESRAPGRFALHEIRLNHPETNANIGRVRMAEVQRSEGKWSVRLTHPELEQRELTTAWKIAHDWFLCRPQSGLQAACVAMNELAIHAGSGKRHLLSNVTAKLLPAGNATLLNVQFSPGAVGASAVPGSAGTQSQPVQWIVKRHHRAEGLKTEMQLRTGSTAVPCSLLADRTPWGERLGAGAQFSGTLDLDLRSDSWRVALIDARLTGVKLEQLTADSETVLSGTGELLFEQLVVNQRGIQLARLSGEVRDGKMAANLYHALGKYLGVAVQETNQVSLYGFDRLLFAADIRRPNLHFRLQMSDAHGLLAAREQAELPLPLENVVAALASGSAPNAMASTANSAEPHVAGIPTTWLSRLALVWLPLGDPQWQAAQDQLRLSSLQAPNANQ